MTVMVFGYLILNSIDFYFFFSVLSLALVLNGKIYQTFKIVVDHISEHLKVRQKYCAACRIFNSLLCIWKYG